MGFLHFIDQREDFRADFVPVDLVANAIITAGYRTAIDHEANCKYVFQIRNTQPIIKTI